MEERTVIGTNGETLVRRTVSGTIYGAYVKYDALNPQLNHLSCSQFMKYMSNSGLKRVQVKDLKELRKIS